MAEQLPELQEFPEQPVHEFVNLMLARLTSHPEEYHSKWKILLDQNRGAMTKKERELIKNKEREVLLGLAHVKAMQLLMEEPTPEQVKNTGPKRPYQNPLLGAYQSEKDRWLDHQKRLETEMKRLEILEREKYTLRSRF